MEIETDRLIIKLLTLSQLRLWVNEISTLEKKLNCKYDTEPMEEIFLDIVRNKIKIIEDDTENYMYYSFCQNNS
ncbi:MAG: hypothetical protein LBT56_01265 [Prevotellaceae bacterium]|nr:hypothetical protein [Prevotellaceae bacterium]